jgi:hypothetical protein
MTDTLELNGMLGSLRNPTEISFPEIQFSKQVTHRERNVTQQRGYSQQKGGTVSI